VPNPKVRKQRRGLTGDVPSPIDPRRAAVSHTRCPHIEERCRRESRPLQQVGRRASGSPPPSAAAAAAAATQATA